MTKEQQIEEKLINKLIDLKYSYRVDIRDRQTLESNFRAKFEALNRVNLTDAEFTRLKDEIITKDVFAASKTLRLTNSFTREDGTPLNYSLVNLDDWCKNEFEVINQPRINTENSHHRYDVILLINGIPVVQIELKTLQISPRRAMAQIVDYKNDPGNGYTNSLLCFMQLFIVSNQTDTYYFANNSNEHFSFNADEQFLPVYKHADENNRKIEHLDEFTATFLEKCTLGKMISNYMVLVASEQKMLIMRPYQIYAVKAIVDCINQNRGNGYIWHTTGSGKTLTSFKASTLLKDNPDVDKCLFVVDRKDLDRQTREEFNKFQDGCVEHNTNTEVLVRRLLSEAYADKVIVTTIQKLGLALDENSKRNKARLKRGEATFKARLEPLRDNRMVFIFDECHRSQFGDNHQAIKDFFPKSQLFGFTGTPIFEENSTYQTIEGKQASYKTTKDIFENELHAYTITHAIEDRYVLSFHIDYFGKDTGKKHKKIKKEQTPPPKAVVKEILKKHDSATKDRLFNTVLATSSINDAIKYHELFKTLQAKKQAEDADFSPLNIACVFSPPAQAIAKDKNTANDENVKDIKQLQEDLSQERKDNKHEPEKKKTALINIINDYNRQYGTNHSIYDFDNYYQDVQQRIKDHKYPNSDYPHKNKIDIIIVVDMLLTGFDSKYLNTLYVDKNLKHHGLIQAFSRTNRILNDTKPHGNILDFRAQEAKVNYAIELFSGEAKDNAKEIWLVDEAPVVIARLDKAVTKLQEFMQNEGVAYAPEEVNNLKGDAARIGFINHFKKVQRLKTRLEQYTDLDAGSKQNIEAIMPQDTQRSFKAKYLETAQRLKAKQDRQGQDASDELQQLDFEFVLFNSALIDYDYIMDLIANSTQEKGRQKMTRKQLIDMISASANMMEQREDIIEYINSLPAEETLDTEQIKNGFQKFKGEKNNKAIADLSQKHSLSQASLQDFIDQILNRMIFDGEQLTDLMAPLDLGWKERSKKELALMEEMVPLLKKLADGHEISGLAVYE